MKKNIAVLTLLVVLFCTLLPGAVMAQDEKVKIVTTIFPIYDWTREITRGDDTVEITMLLDSGVDLHSFQPTAADILRIATCDLFIYVGGESDEWVEDALAEVVNPDMKVISLLDALGNDVKTEELVEGMEAEEEEEGEEEEEEADEHVWLSLRNAEKLAMTICDQLSEIHPDSAALYAENLQTYLAQLDELDAVYTETVSAGTYHTILFGDRFPFRYLADDYGLNYYAAFAGCSAETEASFQTIVFLAQKVDELHLPAVLTIEGTNHKIAETIIGATAEKNQKLLIMDSMQGTTAADVEAGATYLNIMRSNLQALAEALN